MSEDEQEAVSGDRTRLKIAQILSTISSTSLKDLSDARCRWIPQDALLRAISENTVLDLLQSRPQLPGKPQPDYDELAKRISPPINQCRCGRSDCTGGRILFAASLSLSKPELANTLFSNSNEVVCDAGLDLLPPESATPDHLAQARGGLSQAWSGLSQAWSGLSHNERQRFLHFTWQFRSPLMQVLSPTASPTEEKHKVEYPAHVSLPWIRLSDPGETHEEENTVQRLKIHSDHIPEGPLHGDLALKILNGYDPEKQYDREVAANRSAPQHDRIVPLLAAFNHRKKFHLVIPWADEGNLANLFEKYTTSTISPGKKVAEWYSVQWLLAECWGLADGLAAVHSRENSAQIHADIKPENILCFTTTTENRSQITLKLADFGQAQQLNVDGNVSVPLTKTYRPPEYDTGEAPQLNYDVWCLACVYLEFITWAIAGSEILDIFDDARLNEVDDRRVSTAKGTVLADTFFKKKAVTSRRWAFPRIQIRHQVKTIKDEVETIQDEVGTIQDEVKTIQDEDQSRGKFRRRHRWFLEYHRKTHVRALVKKVVKEHITLLQTKCTDTELHTFLGYIDSSMLVVNPTQRAQSSDVRAFLADLQQRASEHTTPR